MKQEQKQNGHNLIATGKVERTPFSLRVKKWDIVKNFGLYMLLLPSLIYLIVFAYLPMVGVVVAFQDYDPFKGIFGSEFVAFENFVFFFRGSEWLSVTVNTIYLNLLFIITGTVASIAIAIMLTSIKGGILCKTLQTFMTLPNFVSWPTVALFAVAFLNGDGIINGLIQSFGGDKVNFYSNPDVWPGIFVIIRLWKGAGWGAIVYMAAIVGLDNSLYEAALLDGCGKFKAIFKITLPLIKPTIVLLALMSIGNIFRGDFGMIYPFIGENALLYPTTNVIDTYLFRAIKNSPYMGVNMAIGLYQSLMGLILVFIANTLARKLAPESAIF